MYQCIVTLKPNSDNMNPIIKLLTITYVEQLVYMHVLSPLDFSLHNPLPDVPADSAFSVEVNELIGDVA